MGLTNHQLPACSCLLTLNSLKRIRPGQLLVGTSRASVQSLAASLWVAGSGAEGRVGSKTDLGLSKASVLWLCWVAVLWVGLIMHAGEAVGDVPLEDLPHWNHSKLVGRSYLIRYKTPGAFQEHLMTFQAGGHLEFKHPADTTPHNDRWEQNGISVTLYINDQYVRYQGRIGANGTSIRGQATNIRGKQWDFVCQAVPSPIAQKRPQGHWSRMQVQKRRQENAQ